MAPEFSLPNTIRSPPARDVSARTSRRDKDFMASSFQRSWYQRKQKWERNRRFTEWPAGGGSLDAPRTRRTEENRTRLGSGPPPGRRAGSLHTHPSGTAL